MTNLQPLGDRLIVKTIEEDEVTTSGIYVPSTAQDLPQRATVLAVGPGAKNNDGVAIPVALGVGDEVYFAKYGGTEIKLDGDEVLILRESDVFAKVVA